VVTSAIAESKEAVWDAMTSAATVGQTVDLFIDSWRDISGFAKKAAKYARSKHKTRKNILRLFAQKWLEYRYGWLPTLYDLEDAMKALDSELKKGDIVRGKSRVVVDLSESDSKTTFYSGDGHLFQTDTLIGTRTYRGSAYAEVLSNKARFGADPLITGYELIPYSFVLDWVLDVGTWLQAVSPFSGAKLLGSMGSVSDEYTKMQEDYWSFDASGSSGSFSGRSTVLEVKQYTRFVHEGGVLPSWNPRITPKRVIDLVALILTGHRETMRALR
jgi:hypothetical protein